LPSLEPSSKPSNVPGPAMAVFQFELMTDNFPLNTYWELMNVYTNDVVASVPYYTYDRRNFLYQESLNIEDNQCYRFIFSDYYNNGLGTGGYFKIFYEGQLILEGSGDFGYHVHSTLFGNGCLNV
jgi:hypothetical protein